MTHPLVTQLRFTRSEFLRAVKGVSDADARQRIMPMNCISWNIGHLAWQEQRCFMYFVQGKVLIPELNEAYAFGSPASTPPIKEVLQAWHTVTAAVDPWLDTVNNDLLLQQVVIDGKTIDRIFGNIIQRVIYHYWYHLGENMAIRQQLGHKHLPVFVGDIDTKAPFQAG